MNSSLPICINCKYFLSEPTGVHRLTSSCAITAIDPVTGEDSGKAKPAAYYRGQNGLCGPSGKFFQKADKPVVKKEKPKPEVPTISIDVPELKVSQDLLDATEAISKQNDKEAEAAELLPKEPGQKRRRRSK